MAQNDIGIITGIVAFFLLLGFTIPFVQIYFDQPETNVNYEGLEDNMLQGVDNADDLTGLSVVTGNVPSIFEILLSMTSIFFWSFAGIPTWLNLLLFIPRAMLVITIGRNVWIGGGA